LFVFLHIKSRLHFCLCFLPFPMRE
jgi:hypothetical protein